MIYEVLLDTPHQAVTVLFILQYSPFLMTIRVEYAVYAYCMYLGKLITYIRVINFEKHI